MKTDMNLLATPISMKISPNGLTDGAIEGISRQFPPVSGLNQICNTEMSQSTRSVTERQSAEVIKNFMRKVVAAQSYGKMFTKGSRFKALNQAMPAFKGKANFQALDHLDVLSQHYLREIKTKTPDLNADEKRLLAQIVDSPVTFRHQSNRYLARDGKLNLFSLNKIDSMNISTGTHTKEQDKIEVANHDFVFFGVEFSEDKTVMPLNQKHMGTNFGANAYLIDNVYPHGYLTLTDHFYNHMHDPRSIEHKEFASQFSQGVREVFRYVSGDKHNSEVPVYSAKDMKLGLGLELINFLRKSKDDGLRAFAFKKELPLKALDRLINFVFQPEFHLPRMVSTTNFKEVKLREISLEEAVKAANLECLNELVKTQKSAREAMILAIKARKENIILNLFARFTFTKEDVLLMNKTTELAYILSDCDSKTSILKLFIDKGLVDAFSQFKFTNKGKTMLDNALLNGNGDMMVFLENLGVQTEEEIKFDLKEAVLSSNIDRVNRMATSKEKISEMLVTAVANKKIEVVKSLLDKNKLTQADIDSIYFHGPLKGNLLYVLSGKDADINILCLFLDKGLIDIHSQMAFCGVRKNMLDNASEHGREDIVSLLKMYVSLKE